jgi:hypothetical protein
MNLPNIETINLPSIEFRDFILGMSFLISVLTAYWNILRGAKFISPPLRQILFARIGQSQNLVVNFPVSITNTGNRTGVIDSLYLELMNLSTRQVEKFYSWQEGGIGALFTQPFWENIAKPITLKSGESIVNFYTFFPDSPDFIYECGLHTISLYAYINGYRKPIKLYNRKLEIDSIPAPNSPTEISMLSSYKLLPTEILKVSDYGNISSEASIIQIAKN